MEVSENALFFCHCSSLLSNLQVFLKSGKFPRLMKVNYFHERELLQVSANGGQEFLLFQLFDRILRGI